MPFDAKTFTETPARVVDPFTLEALIAWIETMPAARRYCYTDNGLCLISQYLMAKRLAHAPCVGAQHWSDQALAKPLLHRVSPGWNSVAVGKASDAGWTFGAALNRARELIAARG